MDQLGLVEPVEALGEGVIVGIPFGSDAVDDAGLGQPFGVANREVLNSAVAVMPPISETPQGRSTKIPS
jgi:hypothetical protein